MAGFKSKEKLQTFLDLVKTSTSIAFPEDKLRLICEKLNFELASGGNALKNDRPPEKAVPYFSQAEAMLILESRLSVHKTFFMPRSFSLAVQNMGLKRMLSGNWFTRLVMISWIICAVSIVVLFKNMELIVHGQLYSYGLILSPDWADPYRIYTWLIYLCLGLPMAFSGVALVSSFLKVEEVPERSNLVQQRPKPPQGITRVESPPTVKKAPKRVNGVNVGIPCPHCKKVFSRALVMLDFHEGKHQLVSVCPYCNHVLGNSGEEKDTNETVHVTRPDEKIIY